MTDTRLLKETPWETRNLGFPSYALRPEFFDAPDFPGLEGEMRSLIAARGRLFVSARLGKQHLAQVPELQALGFYLVECSVSPVMVLGKNPVLLRFEREPEAFIPGRYSPGELEFTTPAEKSGTWTGALAPLAAGSFSDDRFHLDHRCPPELADRRFAYWIADLLGDPAAVFHLLRLRGELIGFCARKGDHPVVAGFGRGRTTSGLGEYFWLSICRAAKTEGLPSLRTQVSCNNLPSLNLCARIGFRFTDTAYTFHLWRG